ncbi:MAG: outer membrane protein assembly factor BamD [Gammaproteobacteria bacterium]|nr:outer membrane protein assembly factor BamD [Gammaproteobacteria bacterium]
MINSKVFVLISLILTLVGCSGKDDMTLESKRMNNAFKLFEKAKYSMLSGNYRSAVEYLERLDSLYPFGDYSEQSQLNLIYSYYKLDDQAKGVAAADRFIRHNTKHKDLDYAYYMKGLIYYSADTGFGSDVFSSPLPEKDTENARKSFESFAEMIRLFPNSKYAKDAQLRMFHLRNQLAKHELFVANYYMKREAYQAALARAQYVVDHYPRTPSVPYALHMMMTAYDLLDLPEKSENTRRVLLLNFPGFKG